MSDVFNEVFIQRCAGRTQGRFFKGHNENLPVVLLLPPDPRLNASMNNKVIRSIFCLLVEKGFSVLAINYRGVGKSEGIYEQGSCEVPDASAAIDWIQENVKFSHIWVAGFSFGAWIGMQLLMRRPEIANFISISLPLGKYDFSFLSPCPTPGIIIHGEDDSIVPVDSISQLVYGLHQQRDYQFITHKVIKNADHLFSSKQERSSLCDVISSHIEDRLNAVEEVDLYAKKEINMFIDDDDEYHNDDSDDYNDEDEDEDDDDFIEGNDEIDGIEEEKKESIEVEV